MRWTVEVKGGKIIRNGDKIRDFVGTLEDGSYVVTLERANLLLTERDCQKAYFDKVDICVAHTGNDRYTIHEEFKKYSETPTTTNLTVEQWRELLRKFEWWAHNNFNCLV